MDEYIKLSDVIAAIRNIPRGNWSNERYSASVKAIPAADVAPVVHGKWEYNTGDNIPYCSECMMPQDSECNFCPNCGARMDGDA